MTREHFQCTPLHGYRIPDDSVLRRDHVRPFARRTEHYEKRYDRQTLYYDCVYLDDTQTYVFTAPRFFNLWEPFRRGLMVDDKPARKVRRQVFEKGEQIEVKATKGTLSLQFLGVEHPVSARDSLASHFDGLNALMAVSKNNRLDWIEDWARYHIAQQNVQAITIIDNGSTDYDAEEILDRLALIDGLKAANVYSAPFPYGPNDSLERGEHSPRFFQSSMFNLARRDVLAGSRAVLSVDIDEIVVCDGATSVFDLAVEKPNRMVKIHGEWAYPAPDSPLPASQGAHRWRSDPAKRCRQKWCATPNGFMSRFGFEPHRVGGKMVKLVKKTDQAHLIHCRGTSTGWKDKRFDMPKLKHDPQLDAFMDEHFPDRSQS
ncbi:hypothetical protein [Qingshengfaniella alkalisoli]|uniref:Glycosyl transferase family 2 n=1 Tax=Qingshengfaniella alkalisoli TaxID=2599296 RepID=A0A5B8IWH9_9RHOB|nr:hypothetical protein [Qingshengfaniella alkalisoli]QDY69181.1 hypothetical protein FPZ52_05725 [Qingshengfaniella alkalisoli]